jgi:hypothetical protein
MILKQANEVMLSKKVKTSEKPLKLRYFLLFVPI